MFDKLYSAFAGVAKSLGEKELNEKDVDDALFELEIALLESDVASEVTDAIKADLKARLVGTKVEKSKIAETVRSSLIASVSSLFDATGSLDLLGLINAKKERGEPFLILFVGINGTGKTTSLAKMAHMLQKSKYSVVVAASDTFRAGAIEQLKEHTKRLNIKLVAQNYNSDPAAVARDAVLYAKAHRTDCVLVDTAGRMQTSKNLMEQIAKITKVVNPDVKIFVGDSLAGNDTVNQAREFFEHTKFDGAILTKADADARGGAALSIAKVTSTPVIYVGVGQEYDDLKPFDKETFLRIVFGDTGGEDTKADERPHARDAAGDSGGEDTKAHREDKTVDDAKSRDVLEEKESRIDVQEIAVKRDKGAQKGEEIVQVQTASASVSGTSEPERLEGGMREPGRVQEAEEKTGVQSAEPQGKDCKKPESAQSDDPFEGISDADIAEYSDIFDTPPPEGDREARILAQKIRSWISDGRGKVVDPAQDDDGDNDESQIHDDVHEDEVSESLQPPPGNQSKGKDDDAKDAGKPAPDRIQAPQDKRDEPKKKRGIFGRFRRG